MVGGELITDVRKPEIMVMTSLQAESYLLITPITLQTCHAKPKTQPPDATSFFSVGVGCLPQAAWPVILSKVRIVALQQIKERGALPMIDRGDIRQANRPLQQYLGFTAVGAGYGQFEHKADSLIAKFKEAGGTVRD